MAVPNAEPIAGSETPELEGQVAEQVQPVQETDYGPNFEQLQEFEPEVVEALRSLIETYRTEGLVARRNEIRRIRQARLFWQGLQYGFYDWDRGMYRLPFGTSLGLALEANDDNQGEQPRFAYVVNLYLGFGLSFVALLSQDVPSVIFWPEDANEIEDVTFAKAASKIAGLILDNNDPEELLRSIAYYLWNDGKLGGYVRYVVDGERYGYDEQPEITEGSVKLGEDAYVCPNCGQETPEPQNNIMAALFCQECGTELGPDNFRPAELIPVPQAGRTLKNPKGQEVISIVGGLELNNPVWARDQKEFPYLQWQLEVNRAKLKATYPHIADKLESEAGNIAEDVYARASRLSVAQGLPYSHPGDALYSLVTYLRTWIRPWAFYDIKPNDIRDKVLKLFPDGCYIAFAGNQYCEARNERLDDRWRTLNAFPGEGQNRPAVGTPLVDIQEQYNAYTNILAENIEMGIPPIYADPQVLDFDALANQVAEPGAHFPARARPGQPLAAGFFQPPPASVTPEMAQYMQELMGPVSQFLTGLFPAVYGGSMDNVKTASAYAMARDQAMGRIGMVWRSVKLFWADLLQLAVMSFRDNRPDDVTVTKQRGGDFAAETIRLMDLRGNVQARPETDETYPRLRSQKMAALQQLMGVEEPIVQEFFEDPANLGLVKGIFGLSEFHVPGEDERNKQMREIETLLAGQAAEVDPLLDSHKIEFMECVRWANSDAGQAAKMQNPAGFLAVRNHAMQHQQFLMPPPMEEPSGVSEPSEPPKKPSAENPGATPEPEQPRPQL